MSDMTLAVAAIAVAIIGVAYMVAWAVIFEVIQRKKW